MTKNTQKLSYLFLATASLISSVNASDVPSQIIERNCHDCPTTEELTRLLNDIKLQRDDNEYEMSAFNNYPIISNKGNFEVTDTYSYMGSDSTGYWKPWFLPFSIPYPLALSLKLPLQPEHLKLYETTKDTNGVPTCIYRHSDIDRPTIYFKVRGCENNPTSTENSE